MNPTLFRKVGMSLVLLATFAFVSLMIVVDTSFKIKSLEDVIEPKNDVFAKKLSTISDAPPVWMVGKLSEAFDEYGKYIVNQDGIDYRLSQELLKNLGGNAKNYTSSYIDENLGKTSWRSQTLKEYTAWMMERDWVSFTDFEMEFQVKVKDLNRSAIQAFGISPDRQSGMKLDLMMIGAPDFLKTGLWAWLIFGLAFIGAMIAFWPLFMMKPGIHNNHVFHRPATSGKGSAWLVLGALVLFYIGLYKFPAYLANQAVLLDPFSNWMSGGASSQWFLYGFLYTFTMFIMGIRMMVKYRGNKYQQVRTSSVFFFQVAFAFTLPQILTRLQLPAYDVKSIWPLEYTFFFDYRVDEYMANGTMGLFLMFWGIVLFAVGVPLLTYFYGKRWYCSWVCGCGGLAETVGDPYRQLSDKSIGAWKFERYIVHGVLAFAVLMTAAVAYTAFTGEAELLGINSYNIRDTYGFFIGFVFAGAVGTGFYPKLGNRVWCRFGCPLAAYLGLVQRFKSRFRITTNGGQCISCGNCSTYCEMGIDVRWYAQRGQNIVRSSCVGCGVCSAVCPRGVLKLENAGTEGRINDNPILIGRDGAELNM
jgi:Pyruvate/2-oxoacid:ferredoxin oxidoreductase delta subunit